MMMMVVVVGFHPCFNFAAGAEELSSSRHGG